MPNRSIPEGQPFMTVQGGFVRSLENQVAIIRALGLDLTIRIFHFSAGRSASPVTILIENIRGHQMEIQQQGGRVYNVIRADTTVMFEAQGEVMQSIRVACAAQPEEFDFFFFGDVHGVFPNLRQIIAAANRQNPLFIIANGDLTHSGHLDEYHTLADLLNTSRVPCFTSLGNHDKRAIGGRRAYRQLLSPYYYSFEVAGATFIVLDSSRKRGLPKAQYRWLERELWLAQGKRIFVILHRPPVCPKYNYLSFSATTNIHRFLTLMAQYQVEMVFSSHIHILTTFHRKQIPYIVSGGGGGALWQPANVHHYLHVFVKRDGVEIRAIELPTPEASIGQRLKDAIRFNMEFYARRHKMLKQALLLGTTLLVNRSVQHQKQSRWMKKLRDHSAEFEETMFGRR